MELRIQEGISAAESQMRELARVLNARADVMAYGRIYQDLDVDDVIDTRSNLEQDVWEIVEALDEIALELERGE